MAVKPKKEFEPNDRKRLAGSLQGMHLLFATFTKTQELCLSDAETETLTGALADVLDKHEINVTGGVSVEVTLIMAILMIEGPRFKLLLAARKSAKHRAPEPAPVSQGGSLYY